MEGLLGHYTGMVAQGIR